MLPVLPVLQTPEERNLQEQRQSSTLASIKAKYANHQAVNPGPDSSLTPSVKERRVESAAALKQIKETSVLYQHLPLKPQKLFQKETTTLWQKGMKALPYALLALSAAGIMGYYNGFLYSHAGNWIDKYTGCTDHLNYEQVRQIYETPTLQFIENLKIQKTTPKDRFNTLYPEPDRINAAAKCASTKNWLMKGGILNGLTNYSSALQLSTFAHLIGGEISVQALLIPLWLAGAGLAGPFGCVSYILPHLTRVLSNPSLIATAMGQNISSAATSIAGLVGYGKSIDDDEYPANKIKEKLVLIKDDAKYREQLCRIRGVEDNQLEEFLPFLEKIKTDFPQFAAKPLAALKPIVARILYVEDKVNEVKAKANVLKSKMTAIADKESLSYLTLFVEYNTSLEEIKAPLADLVHLKRRLINPSHPKMGVFDFKGKSYLSSLFPEKISLDQLLTLIFQQQLKSDTLSPQTITPDPLKGSSGQIEDPDQYEDRFNYLVQGIFAFEESHYIELLAKQQLNG